MRGMYIVCAYFINVHGITAFYNIKTMILSKIKSFRVPIDRYIKVEDFYSIYVLYIFAIAFGEFIGLNNKEITKYLQFIMTDKIVKELSIIRAKQIHRDAINEIHEYLKQTTDKVKGVL